MVIVQGVNVQGVRSSRLDDPDRAVNGGNNSDAILSVEHAIHRIIPLKAISLSTAGRCIQFRPKHWVHLEVDRLGCKFGQVWVLQARTGLVSCNHIERSPRLTATKASFIAGRVSVYASFVSYTHSLPISAMSFRKTIHQLTFMTDVTDTLLNLTTFSRDDPDSSRTFFRLPSDSSWQALALEGKPAHLVKHTVAALISPIPT